MENENITDEFTKKKRRILLRVAYDGTAYHGWQLQPVARTIEGELGRAIQALTGEEIRVIGASRTDAGVHALDNVAVFDTSSGIPDEKFAYALNRYLPDDIVVQSSTGVEEDFHPRHQDCRKTYEYSILNRRQPLPLYRNTAHFIYGALDLQAMREACSYFVGEHDFASLQAAGAQVQSTVRTIYRLEVLEYELAKEAARLLVIRVQGNGFLYNMVRIIAGTLLEVGRGRLQPQRIPEILAAKDRSKAGPTAPAKGLMLAEIHYEV